MNQMLRTPKDLYKEYIELYRHAVNLTDYEDYDKTWKVLKHKEGFPVRYVDSKALMDYLPMDTNLVGENQFYDLNPYFYMIPNEINKTIISFVLRGLKKDYTDYKGLSIVKPFFGIRTFMNYTQGKPIILCEGAKDCIALQKIYPFTLGLLGVGLTKTNITILSKLTNKLILAYDNDIEGNKKIKVDIATLKANKFNVLSFMSKDKDFGEDFNNILEYEDSLSNLIKAFPKFNLKDTSHV